MTTMIASILLTLSTALSAPAATHPANEPEPSKPVLLSKSMTDADDRQWAASRPSRGAHASAVRQAATFPRSLRPFASCVLARESGGTLDRRESGSGSRNPYSTAQGRWQFLDNLWRGSLAGQVASRLRQFGMPRSASAEARRWLERHEIAQWPGILQDIGFIEVIERGGSYHWRLAGSRCEAYR